MNKIFSSLLCIGLLSGCNSGPKIEAYQFTPLKTEHGAYGVLLNTTTGETWTLEQCKVLDDPATAQIYKSDQRKYDNNPSALGALAMLAGDRCWHRTLTEQPAKEVKP